MFRNTAAKGCPRESTPSSARPSLAWPAAVDWPISAIARPQARVTAIAGRLGAGRARPCYRSTQLCRPSSEFASLPEREHLIPRCDSRDDVGRSHVRPPPAVTTDAIAINVRLPPAGTAHDRNRLPVLERVPAACVAVDLDALHAPRKLDGIAALIAYVWGYLAEAGERVHLAAVWAGLPRSPARADLP